LPVGLLAAHLVHAAGESGAGHRFAPHTNAVVLGCSLAALERLRTELTAAGVAHVPVFEDTPPFKDQLTALGLSPTKKSVLKPHLKKLKLFGKEAPG